jgi:hypothetical protein
MQFLDLKLSLLKAEAQHRLPKDTDHVIGSPPRFMLDDIWCITIYFRLLCFAAFLAAMRCSSM